MDVIYLAQKVSKQIRDLFNESFTLPPATLLVLTFIEEHGQASADMIRTEVPVGKATIYRAFEECYHLGYIETVGEDSRFKQLTLEGQEFLNLNRINLEKFHKGLKSIGVNEVNELQERMTGGS
jgi:hypothetical protein